MALNLGAPTEEVGPEGTRIVTPKLEPLQIHELQKQFPQFEIIEFLGRGGMGLVYKARHPRLDRLVALKILAPDTHNRGKFAERFEREARALARLSHPNIVGIYDFGETESLYFLVMEFVDGMNLRDLIRTRKMKPEEALAIVPAICDALQFAHNQGIVHRDIKPENILLDKQGRVKIADFGIAKIIGAASRENLTGEQQAVGTPHYMAPEQIETPAIVDHRADIYSLGVVFYEMLTGELPLGKFAAPSRKVQVDVRLDEVVLHALEKEPGRRYQHASEVKTDVQAIAATPDSAAPEISREPASSAFQSRERRQTPGSYEFKFNLFPRLLPGEQVLHFKKWLWRLSSKSLPSYRVFFSLPPLCEAGLYITNRRIIIVSSLIRLLSQEFNIWFSKRINTANVDVLQNVSLGRGFFGDYLETRSEAANPAWYRSASLRLRFFTAEAELLRKIISDAQKAAAESNEAFTDDPTIAETISAPRKTQASWLPLFLVGLILTASLVAWGVWNHGNSGAFAAPRGTIEAANVTANQIVSQDIPQPDTANQVNQEASVGNPEQAPNQWDYSRAVSLFNDIEDFGHEFEAAFSSRNLSAAKTGVRRLMTLLTNFNAEVKGTGNEFPPEIFEDIAKVAQALEEGDWDKAKLLARHNQAYATKFRTIGLRIADQALKLRLNNDQRAVLEWTDRQFYGYFDARTFEGLSTAERTDLETRLLDQLKGPHNADYFTAINSLAALQSKRAIEPLRAIAFDRAEKNNRDRWMAVRALGIMGDKASIPDLIQLLYHGNSNTRWWAQISLVRLTGQNSGRDWKMWAQWWKSGGQPAFSSEMVQWSRDPEWSEPEKLEKNLLEYDKRFLEQVRASAPKQ